MTGGMDRMTAVADKMGPAPGSPSTRQRPQLLKIVGEGWRAVVRAPTWWYTFPAMLTSILLALVLPAALASFNQAPATDKHAAVYPIHRPADLHLPKRTTGHDLRHFDVVQHTCALYVALRSSAWERPVSFGQTLDELEVQWNMCPGGTMVACAKVPMADGDSVITGIPWPYGDRAGL